MTEKTSSQTPTLYEWLGSDLAAFTRLIEAFYDLTLQDELLAPLFTHMPPQHRENVARWFAEVFGGPKRYSEERGSHRTMILKHQQFSISEAQRRRWTELMVDAADAIGLPTDPEFRSAFTAYVEWGTRMALMYTQPGVGAPGELPMPTWGWGEASPYLPATEENE
jgi:hemoglobin